MRKPSVLLAPFLVPVVLVACANGNAGGGAGGGEPTATGGGGAGVGGELAGTTTTSGTSTSGGGAPTSSGTTGGQGGASTTTSTGGGQGGASTTTSTGAGQGGASTTSTTGGGQGGASTTTTTTTTGGGDPCGNGIIDTGEQCETGDLAGRSCVDFGYSNAAGLACADNCAFDLSGCAATCDGQLVEPGEPCDGDLGDADCTDYGFVDTGAVSCQGCELDLAECQAVCGNDHAEPGEDCDGLDVPEGVACDEDCHAVFADVRLNEVFFDSVGQDEGLFVELLGPPGAALDGFEIGLVNGASGGDEYVTVELDGEVIGSAGYFVVASSQVPVGAGANRLVVAGFDPQNGPDNVVLRDGGRVVDAVGYGTFEANHVFAGEGDPAPDVESSSGHSIQRVPNGSDTDDNAIDFVAAAPSPGAANVGL